MTLDVGEEWRRRGLAGTLMEAAEVRARAAGAGVMGLHVFTGNEGAVGFYEGRGYVRVGVVPGFYGRVGDAYVYRKGALRGCGLATGMALRRRGRRRASVSWVLRSRRAGEGLTGKRRGGRWRAWRRRGWSCRRRRRGG